MGRLYNQLSQKDKRQYLRNNSTRAERLLWTELKGSRLGFKFRRQHSIGFFVLDFYCPELKLAIEVDGSSHDSEEAKKYDKQRQAIIEVYGVRFFRVTDDEVHGNIEKVSERIREEIEKLRKS